MISALASFDPSVAITPLLALGAEHQYLAYGGFLVLIAFFLALDLGVFHREAKEIGFKESIVWSIVWLIVALLFIPLVWLAYEQHWFDLGLQVPKLGSPGEFVTVSGDQAAQLFFTGYFLERALAMDNTFVIALVFGYLAIPGKYQHRVLFWGILGAVIMRGLMIFLGAALVASFGWIIYVFAAILILTALKMAFTDDEASDPSKNIVVRLLHKILPVSDQIDGSKFVTRIDGRLFATPLLVALILVEFTDLVFAVDSIPAIFAITADPFILFTSNIFAILGLRALYFCIAALIARFRFLKPALIVVLFFIGVKMLLHEHYHVDETTAMLVVVGILGVGAVASAVLPAKNGSNGAGEGDDGSARDDASA
jgi:tellurite resistance protein TerC